MAQYKLYYFPLRGRAETIRFMFHYKGIPFEDIHVPFEEWPSKKSTFPFGQMPILEAANGKQLAQSWAIYRYLAGKLGLDGKDECEKAHLDQVLEAFRDMSDSFWPYFITIIGVVKGDKDQLRKDKVLPSLAKHAAHFERFLNESGSGFFAKSGVSYVDFYVATIMYNVYKHEKELMEAKYPFFIKHMRKVHALPELQRYLSGRKDFPG